MVALHLTRGYTLPQTADMLYVSLDTVRTHVKSLYKKLGIHKKQSLIAIVEEKRQAPQ
ncbi:MAG: LuxR C-terminal-related transcriptional regulator [Gordonibacter sp.]